MVILNTYIGSSNMYYKLFRHSKFELYVIDNSKCISKNLAYSNNSLGSFYKVLPIQILDFAFLGCVFFIFLFLISLI